MTRWFTGATLGLSMLAIITIGINLADGLEPGAALRGSLAMLRIPAAITLAISLRDQVSDGRNIAIGLVAGTVALIGNGLYTSTTLEATRFTAATFGRNGFGLALVTGAVLATGLAVQLRRQSHDTRTRVASTAVFVVAASALFGAIATGTRMSLLVAVPTVAVALIVNRSWWHRRGVAGVGALAVGVILISLAATLWTTEGARALSGILNPGGTVDIITDPESEPDYSPVRTRTRWWTQALDMAAQDPWTGVGPYQWNIRRYELEPDAVPVVADPHNSYIQLAAEYGYPVAVVYAGTLLVLAVAALVTVWRRSSPARNSPIAVSLVGVALMAPITELTNSHFFNVRLGMETWLLLGVAGCLTVIPAIVSQRSVAQTLATDLDAQPLS
jgi:O-antigen ligase